MGRPALRIPTPERLDRRPGDDDTIRDLVHTGRRNLDRLDLLTDTTVAALTTTHLADALTALRAWCGDGHVAAVTVDAHHGQYAILAAVTGRAGDAPLHPGIALAARSHPTRITRPLGDRVHTVHVDATGDHAGTVARHAADLAEHRIRITHLDTNTSTPARTRLRYQLEAPHDIARGDLDTLLATPDTARGASAAAPGDTRTRDQGHAQLTAIGSDPTALVAHIAGALADDGADISAMRLTEMAGHAILTAHLTGSPEPGLADRIRATSSNLACAIRHVDPASAPAAADREVRWWATVELGDERPLLDTLAAIAAAGDSTVEQLTAHEQHSRQRITVQLAAPRSAPPTATAAVLRELCGGTLDAGAAPAAAWDAHPER